MPVASRTALPRTHRQTWWPRAVRRQRGDGRPDCPAGRWPALPGGGSHAPVTYGSPATARSDGSWTARPGVRRSASVDRVRRTQQHRQVLVGDAGVRPAPLLRCRAAAVAFPGPRWRRRPPDPPEGTSPALARIAEQLTAAASRQRRTGGTGRRADARGPGGHTVAPRAPGRGARQRSRALFRRRRRQSPGPQGRRRACAHPASATPGGGIDAGRARTDLR